MSNFCIPSILDHSELLDEAERVENVAAGNAYLVGAGGVGVVEADGHRVAVDVDRATVALHVVFVPIVAEGVVFEVLLYGETIAAGLDVDGVEPEAIVVLAGEGVGSTLTRNFNVLLAVNLRGGVGGFLPLHRIPIAVFVVASGEHECGGEGREYVVNLHDFAVSGACLSRHKVFGNRR